MMDLKSLGHYDDGYQEGYEKSKAEKQSTDNFVTFLKLFLMILFPGFIFSSSLFASYFILRDMTFYKALAGWEKVLSVLTLAYLLCCLVFFFKGIMIVFKVAKRGAWIVIWFVCFLFICLLPVGAIYFMLELSLGPSIIPARQGISHYKFWSLTGAVLAGAILYYRYGLTTDKSLRITAWSYRSGIRAGAWLLKRK